MTYKDKQLADGIDSLLSGLLKFIIIMGIINLAVIVAFCLSIL